jgi:MFS family permease
MLGFCAALVGFGVPSGRGRAMVDARRGTASVRELATVCGLVLGCLTQVFFLTAILPQVLPRLGVPEGSMLEVGGLVLLADGLGMALGTMAAPRLAEAFGDRRAVPWLLACASLCLAALALATSVWTFVALRFAQVLCIAPVFPLAVAGIAHRASGEAIGFLNSARIGAQFIGPVFATTLLAYAPPSSVEITLALIGLALVPLMARARSGAPRDRGPA